MPRPEVVVYTTTNCTRCMLVKRFLASHNIPFHEVQVFRVPGAIDELIKLTGALAAPVVIVGKRFIRGYNLDAMTSLLEEEGWIHTEGNHKERPMET